MLKNILFDLDPKECLMVGNDAEEDLAALKTGTG